MARWTGEEAITDVLAAASAWRTRCFEQNTSILTNRQLWTPANLTDLLDRFAGNPIEDANRDFLDKLKEQLAGAPAEVMQVCAEALWFFCLFPSPSLMRANTKREQIGLVWSWSSEPLPNSSFLSDESLRGVGHPGTAYMTYKPAEFEYLIRVVVAFKKLPEPEQHRLLQAVQPWEFMNWLDSQSGSDRRLLRNVLLYFLFPDSFERNTSREHRRQIYEAFKNKLPAEARIRARTRTNGDYDKTILLIRKTLEKELGTSEFDFYQDHIMSQWFTDFKDSQRRNFTSWLDSFLRNSGLQLNQSGRDKKIQTLQEQGAISREEGFWDSGLTAKPPRWIIHFDLTVSDFHASVPKQNRAKAIGYANTKGGDSGALAVRILPVAKLGDEHFEAIDTWEWLLLFCFPRGLRPGSAAQTFEDFDPETGKLTYMGETVPYIFGALLTLNNPDETFTANIGGQQKTITYRDATAALEHLIKFRQPGDSND